ncbi:hypothetical protein VNO80_11163 [Phaseolus coccineus]|uniref:Uncharacterized protein n=1 Tax=Phaseolus coccineus TaxID=3886 RepID=A0AAN9NEU6_PHACN
MGPTANFRKKENMRGGNCVWSERGSSEILLSKFTPPPNLHWISSSTILDPSLTSNQGHLFLHPFLPSACPSPHCWKII